jgi:DNA gyrase subunit B
MMDCMLVCTDGTKFSGDNLQKLVELIAGIEDPLSTLDRRGIDLKHLIATHSSATGLLPRYRVFLGKDQHWFDKKDEVEAFLKAEEARRGDELRVADATSPDSRPASAENGHAHDAPLQVVDLHEVKSINTALTRLKDYGFSLKDLLPAGTRNGEPVYPFRLDNGDNDEPLSSLRELLPKLRKLGEQGLKMTRFKGLGEMNSEELWETSMDPAARVLLQVTMEDAAGADEIFRVLMGDHVEPRREFIEKHALDVRELDV